MEAFFRINLIVKFINYCLGDNRVPTPKIYPGRSDIFTTEKIYIECEDEEALIKYTVNDNAVPTSFYGINVS